MEDKILIVTYDQLKEFAKHIVEGLKGGNDTPSPKEGKRLVYGLRGIMDLFNVSHATAQAYKNGFLAPACSQRGRKIIVDADMALELYEKAKNDSLT